jgi:hypothetical protein
MRRASIGLDHPGRLFWRLVRDTAGQHNVIGETWMIRETWMIGETRGWIRGALGVGCLGLFHRHDDYILEPRDRRGGRFSLFSIPRWA